MICQFSVDSCSSKTNTSSGSWSITFEESLNTQDWKPQSDLYQVESPINMLGDLPDRINSWTCSTCGFWNLDVQRIKLLRSIILESPSWVFLYNFLSQSDRSKFLQIKLFVVSSSISSLFEGSVRLSFTQNATLNMLISASIGFFFRLLLYDLAPKKEGSAKKANGIDRHALAHASTGRPGSTPGIIPTDIRLQSTPTHAIGMPRATAVRVFHILPRYWLPYCCL